jgi:GT2 family glycosyltransferase
MATGELMPAGDDDGDLRPVLSIIVTTYNGRDVLRDCLASIRQNPSREPFEVVVVDDASTDGTAEMVKVEFPEVRLRRNEVNGNYAFANNRGLEMARGQFALLLNSDTIVLPDALDAMIAFLRSHPEAGAVGCRLLNEDGSVQWSVKALPGPAAAIFGARSIVAQWLPNNPITRQHLLHHDRATAEPFVVGLVSGAASMSPMAVIRKVGLLDEQFFYHVDADHCKRIAEAGYKVYYLPTARIIHLNHKGGSMANLRKRFRSLMKFETDSYRYLRKHLAPSPWSPMHMAAVVGLSCHFLAIATAQTLAELASMVRGAVTSGGRGREPARN